MESFANDKGDMVELTEGEIFIVQWQKGMLGSFSTHLALAMNKADPENLAKLEKGFPELVQAMKDWTRGDLHERLTAKGFSL